MSGVLYDYSDHDTHEKIMKWMKENPEELKREVDKTLARMEKYYGASPIKAQDELVFCTRPEEMLH